MDALPPTLAPPLRRRAQAGAAWIRQRKVARDTVLVVHHIDADGVTSGAMAATALERAGVAYRTLAVKSMDQVHQDLVRTAAAGPAAESAETPERVSQDSVDSVARPGASALWFCDLGSTVYMQFPDHARLVCDHHQLVRDGSEEAFPHVNPLLDDLSGEEISGAGCAYLVAAALDDANLDLLPLALVGASGDLQDRKQGAFTGTNALLQAHGQAAGLLHAERDLAYFGPETRPLRRFLAYGEPAVPTVSGSPRNAESFLASLGISDDAPWHSRTAAERTTIRSALVDRLLATGLADRIPQLWRTVVTFPHEASGPTREPQEFATLLNSTARYDRPEIGLAVARGDRGPALAEALELLVDHRKHLSGALDEFNRRGVREERAIQWVHLQDAVRDTVVGIVCGMALDGLGLRRDLALLAFAWTPDGRTKVSSRAPAELQSRGIDLATALRETAAALGGQGGGHKGAAGATIERGQEDAFLARLDAVVARQLGLAMPPPRQLAPQPASGQVRLPGFLETRNPPSSG